MIPRLLRCLAFLALVAGGSAAETAPPPPLPVLLAGLAHGHAGGFLRQHDPTLLRIAGVWEPDDTVWAKYAKQPHLQGVARHKDLAAAVAVPGLGAVWAFSDTRTHLDVVRAAAPRGLAVIVEKPLAVSWADAAEMAALARRHGTLVLTNYETSWYPSFDDVHALLAPGGPLGPVRQIYAHAGHEGPVKIRVGPEFLAWLRDPVRAGGGALFDFGCYGANLATWWFGNRAPVAVSAHTSRFDAVNYPDCDDHAVLQLVYPEMQVPVIGSWHWPFARKDVAVYGETGSVVTVNDRSYSLRAGRKPAEALVAKSPRRNPHAWLAAAVRAGRDPTEDPSSLANNLVVMRILEVARRSAAEGRTIPLAEIGPEVR